jgi:hypothetical protein
MRVALLWGYVKRSTEGELAMILGMSTAAFTQFHVWLSLIGIFSGIVVVLAMLGAIRLPLLTAVFLLTTVATSVTGFMFHFATFGPPEIVGVFSLVILGFAILGLYGFKLAGPWRWIYAASAVFALYLNVFVGVVQTFQKVPFFHALAPTQTELPFALAQGVVLIAFIALGITAAKKFRPSTPGPTFA